MRMRPWGGLRATRRRVHPRPSYPSPGWREAWTQDRPHNRPNSGMPQLPCYDSPGRHDQKPGGSSERPKHKERPTRRCSEREPADSLCYKSNVIGGWLPSLTFEKRSNRRLVARSWARGGGRALESRIRPTTLSIGASLIRRTPSIAVSVTFLAFTASDCNGWARAWGLAQGRERRRTKASGWSAFHSMRGGSGLERHPFAPGAARRRFLGAKAVSLSATVREALRWRTR
jgi:hypothetical protein